MSLNDFLKDQRLKLQPPSKNELEQLFRVVQRDLQDARFPELSSDRKFATAYNAALQLATIALRAKGYRTNPGKSGHHRVCIQALPLVLGVEWTEFSDYLDACRLKRHACEYTSVDEVDDREAKLLVQKTERFHAAIVQWLKQHLPHLLPATLSAVE